MIFLIALSGRVNFESLEKKILAISITLKGLLNKFFVSFKIQLARGKFTNALGSFCKEDGVQPKRGTLVESNTWAYKNMPKNNHFFSLKTRINPHLARKLEKQAGAELCQSKVKLEFIVGVGVELI